MKPADETTPIAASLLHRENIGRARHEVVERDRASDRSIVETIIELADLERVQGG